MADYNLAALKKLAAQSVEKKKKSTKKLREERWASGELEKKESPKERDAPDRVPVRLDHRTTVFVLRSLCEQQADGTWTKKEIVPPVDGKIE